MRSQLLELGFEVPVQAYGFGEANEQEQQGADASTNYVNSQTRCKSICAFFRRPPSVAD